MRWSEDPANTQRYLDAGRRMPEIMGLSKQAALASLPPEQRQYTGSTAARHWPYEDPNVAADGDGTADRAAARAARRAPVGGQYH